MCFWYRGRSMGAHGARAPKVWIMLEIVTILLATQTRVCAHTQLCLLVSWVRLVVALCQIWSLQTMFCSEDIVLSTNAWHTLLTLFLRVGIGPSVLWRCWLGGRKGIPPVKNWALGCWYGYLAGARCRLAYGPADATATHCLLLQ